MKENIKSFATANKRLIFILLIGFLLITNTYSFFLEDLEELPYMLGQKTPYYPLDNWNLAQHQTVDLNSNGIPEHMRFEGCLTLDLDEFRLPPIECDQDDQKRIYSIPEYSLINHSYITKLDSTWLLIRHYTFDIDTYVFDAQRNTFVETTTSPLTITNELIYTITHILI